LLAEESNLVSGRAWLSGRLRWLPLSNDLAPDLLLLELLLRFLLLIVRFLRLILLPLLLLYLLL